MRTRQGVPPCLEQSSADAEHSSAKPEPEPMLSLSLTILAKSSDLGQMRDSQIDWADFVTKMSPAPVVESAVGSACRGVGLSWGS